MFHEPLGGGGGTTDTDGLDTLKPRRVNLVRAFYKVGIGIDTLALAEQHLAIGTLTATDEEDEIMSRGELRDVWHTVGHRATDGVEALESSRRTDVFLDVFDDTMELVERLGGLAI